MVFRETALPGVFIVDLERREDSRGFFARAFCAREFERHGVEARVAQANISFSRHKGTVRGLHYQVPPAAETKLVRCVRGAIWDVVVDLRPDSETYLQHLGVELSADNRRALIVPGLVAHGTQTLTDDAEMLYLVSEFYTPGCERGLRHDDPVLGIRWPLPVTVISDKDAAWPLLDVTAAARARGRR